MFSLSRKGSSRNNSGVSRWLRGGFTLIEVFVGLAVLGTMSAGAYIGFNEVNAYSVSSRLYSEAQAVAQNQIDLILSKGPFNITSVPNRVPPELALGTQTRPNVFVYVDPVNGKTIVTGTMTTVIEDAGATMTFAGVTSPLNVRKAKVTVAYAFRGKDYNVTMETLRTADQ